MPNLIKLESVEELNTFVAQPGKRLLLKHSTVCPISTAAYNEFEAFLTDHTIPAALILVREDRPVSNEVEARFGIKHESPQLFLLDDQKVTWHTSHWKITKQAITEALG
ncbi:bacillithiol system redox-active protein YtxJ [Brevibacillus sp. SYSU BS000544]|uniref:bacillithiol system redox-active protein YtxJ n=1 Tax=Brevibacillus sp. SYSU BS000544 TaxID=3416443 RepID=UPI003CE4BC63